MLDSPEESQLWAPARQGSWKEAVCFLEQSPWGNKKEGVQSVTKGDKEGKSHWAEHKAYGIGRWGGGPQVSGSTMPLCLCYSLSMRCLPGPGKQPDETVNAIVIHGKRKE